MAREKSGRSPSDDEPSQSIPPRKVLPYIVAFSALSLAISVVHACIPSRFDLISVVVAVIAVAAFLLPVTKRLSIAWGDNSAVIEPANVTRVFQETSSLLTGSLAMHGQAVAAAPEPISDKEKRFHEEQGAKPRALAVMASESTQSPPEHQPEPVSGAEDNAVLVRLAVELENTVRNLASKFGANSKATISLLLSELQSRQVLTIEEVQGIKELISLGNEQVHGARMTPALAEYSRLKGQNLITALQELPITLELDTIDEIVARAPSPSPAKASTMVDVIADGVAFEVKISDSKLSQSAGFAKLRQLVDRKEVKGGVLVLAAYHSVPSIARSEQTSDDESEYAETLGMAWRTNNGFEGDATACKLAPWLFTLKKV